VNGTYQSINLGCWLHFLCYLINLYLQKNINVTQFNMNIFLQYSTSTIIAKRQYYPVNSLISPFLFTLAYVTQMKLCGFYFRQGIVYTCVHFFGACSFKAYNDIPPMAQGLIISYSVNLPMSRITRNTLSRVIFP
jgi:hypothetical protein